MEISKWLEEWTKSPFHYILNEGKDETLTASFMENLTKELKLKKGSNILDLACGDGKYSIILNKLGYNLTGIDTSINRIAQAKKFENDSLRFEVADMRETLPNEKFQLVLNLFTNFGFFDDEKDNLKVLNSIREMLDKKGILVLDYLNIAKEIEHLVKKETKEVANVKFEIIRKNEKNTLSRSVSFGRNGRHYSYAEKFQAYVLKDFEKLMKDAKFTIKATFGNYDLSKFDAKKSERLIIVAEKK